MKHSRRERERRVQENALLRDIESTWSRAVAPDVAKDFAKAVEQARARGPQPRRPDMAPGTAPRPPRPGHEPKPPKDAERPRRRG